MLLNAPRLRRALPYGHLSQRGGPQYHLPPSWKWLKPGQRQIPEKCTGTNQVTQGPGGDVRPQVHPSTPAASYPWPGAWIRPAPTQIDPTPLLTPSRRPGEVGEAPPPQPCLLPSQNRSGYSDQRASDVTGCRRRRLGWPPSPAEEKGCVCTGPHSLGILGSGGSEDVHDGMG